MRTIQQIQKDEEDIGMSHDRNLFKKTIILVKYAKFSINSSMAVPLVQR
jgi:hypothetical protein